MTVTRIAIECSGESPYDYRVGRGCSSGLGERLRTLSSLAGCTRILMLTDSNVGPLHGAQVKAVLLEAGFQVDEVTVSAGEQSKSIAVVTEVWSALAQLGHTRKSAILSLGGGMVCDLAGFAAATYMRGVPVVHMPTSLLAMVDAAIGGKTAIDIPEGKNLVGAFHQPAAVFADTAFLDTLPESEMRCGLAEVAKSALLSGDDFFFWLTDAASDQALSREALEEAIVRSVVYKASVVAADPREVHGVRTRLNLGHTLGHALEQCGGYGRFSHGECVAQGIRFASRVAEAELGASAEFTAAQDSLLDALGLARFNADEMPSADDLLASMRRDKKNDTAGITFVVLKDVGRSDTCIIEEGLMREYLDAWISGCR